MQELEKKLNYTFRDPALLSEALSHSSYANEHRSAGLNSNERLEFLGDSVLGFVTAEFLFVQHPNLPEGEDWRGFLMQLGLTVQEEAPLPSAKHVFSHIQWQMRGLALRTAPWPAPEGWAWAAAQELDQYPLPSAFRAYRRAALERMGEKE